MRIKYNPNPVGNRVEDCVQRAMSAALGVSWDELVALQGKIDGIMSKPAGRPKKEVSDE